MICNAWVGMQADKVEEIPAFKPTLLTPETTREKVNSSGYGSPHYVPKVVKERPTPPADKDDPKDLTFRPDMAVTKKVRRRA